jgi:nucleoside triphosphate diphosphatase
VKASSQIDTLLQIMAALRSPGTGCPWDLRQTFETIAPYTIEEAYEVADAIARGDLEDLRDELGDLLLQVVFHARMAEEQQAFDFGAVVRAITGKLLRRHPHVFGDAGPLSEEQVAGLWQRIKAEEKAVREARKAHASAERAAAGTLAGVPAGLPALARALKLQRKAAAAGFDWNESGPVLDKIREELDEVAAAVQSADREQIAGELGDLLFAAVNLARHFGIDPEGALRRANGKFERRFAGVERALAARGRTPQEASLGEMDALWDECKREEKLSAAKP